jgi:fumarate reductase flavoprotein subunit
MPARRIPAIAIVLALSLLWAFAPLLSGNAGSAWAAERSLLIEAHKAAGLNCDACHTESPPKAAATTAACIKCHGNYEAIAKRTEEVTPHNPHESHQGELECGECHHVHKPSEDFCTQCHQFGFKVP